MPHRFGNCYIYNLRERGSGFKPHVRVQDFYKLRDQCLAEGKLFEDPEFPCTDSCILYGESERTYEWKRPVELEDNPKLCVEGASRFDIQQGTLGDCWFVSAMANLTQNTDLFTHVVPDDQDFDKNYAGIFHFRFWQYGRWIDVVVDDRLPTVNNRLTFLHSSISNEFWSALLEKAYAKLYGSYGSLDGGITCEAMEDFTGGVKEVYDLNEAPSNLFEIMIKAYNRSSLMCCGVNNRGGVMQESFGLVEGHAYSVTRVMYVDVATNKDTSGKIPLVRIRNPWGEETEWNGAWSDKSSEWNEISEEKKQEVGLTFENDGEFWMCFEDFCKYFDDVEICNLSPDSLTEAISDNKKRHWEMSFFEGEWVKGVSSGGSADYTETFWQNPQYRIKLVDPDEGDEDNECSVIIALMQKHRRKLRVDNSVIGFYVYHLKEPDSLPKPLDSSFFNNNAPLETSESPFAGSREISRRLKLPPGVYCIVPCTYEPGDEAEFLLRVFSESKNNMEENYAEIGFRDLDKRLTKKNEDNAEEIFRKIAGDDLEVSWIELKEIMDSIYDKHSDGFSKDVCRSMIAMMDSDRSGKLELVEFKHLWSYIEQWKDVFNMYEKGNSGYLSISVLRDALTSAGFNLNNTILNSVTHRYGSKDGQILFEDFIMCAIKLNIMINIFHDKDLGNTNTATFTIEEWVETTVCS